MSLTERQINLILDELDLQTPDDSETQLREGVLRNGSITSRRMFEIASEAGDVGDVRTTAVVLKKIPLSDISIEIKGRVLLGAVRARRDILIDDFGIPETAKAVPEEFAVTQASLNVLRDAIGTAQSQSPLFIDPYANLGRRNINGIIKPISAIPFDLSILARRRAG